MKSLFILILMIIIIPAALLSLAGLIPKVSSIIGTDQPKKLGIKYTTQNLDSAQLKLRQNLLDTKVDPQNKYELTASTPIDISLTSEEYSAHVGRLHPLSEVQIKLKDSNFELSAQINKSRIPEFIKVWKLASAKDLETISSYGNLFPVNPVIYLAGTGTVTNNNLEIHLTKAELGRLPLPLKLTSQLVELYTETLFNKVEGFKVKSAFIKDGHLQFKGTAVSEIPNY